METVAEPVVSPVVVKKSRPGLGHGLFAMAAIGAGEIVVEYTGIKIPSAEADVSKSRYLVEVDSEWTIDGASHNNIARYINHSCEPNCEGALLGERVFIRALREIAAGEEFTLDYGEEYFDEFIKPVGCKCGKCS